MEQIPAAEADNRSAAQEIPLLIPLSYLQQPAGRSNLELVEPIPALSLFH
jgi:hypothetical protein